MQPGLQGSPRLPSSQPVSFHRKSNPTSCFWLSSWMSPGEGKPTLGALRRAPALESGQPGSSLTSQGLSVPIHPMG